MNASTRSMEVETIDTAAFATLFSKGLERAVEIGKTSLDLVLEQNLEALASCKQTLEASYLRGVLLFDFAGQAFASYVTLQKRLMDLAVEQNAAVIQAAQEYSYDFSQAETTTNRLIRRSADRTISAGNSVLNSVTRSKPKR